jgi:hypothetical protein
MTSAGGVWSLPRDNRKPVRLVHGCDREANDIVWYMIFGRVAVIGR